MARPQSISVIVVARRKMDDIKGVVTNLLNQDRVPEEVIVVDADPEGSCAAIANLEIVNAEALRYLCPGTELSVAAARAAGVAVATGEVLVFIRDFARFERYTAMDLILDILRDEQIGGISCIVRDAGTRDLEPLDYPSRAVIRAEEPRDISLLTRCACAIRRTAFDAAGGIDEVVGDSDQELDLSYRIVNAGFRIRYAPSVIVYHRGAAARQMLVPWSYDQVRDHLYLAAKVLPAGTAIVHGLLWTFAAFFLSLPRKEVSDYVQGLRSLWAEGLWAKAFTYRKAHPMTKDAEKYLGKHEGRLVF
jgi:GT2 family glycosyltransferase